MSTKVEAFFEEFPFLATYFDPWKINEVSVSRVSEDTLEERFLKYGEENYPQRIFLFDEQGKLVAKAHFWIRSRSLWQNLQKIFQLYIYGESINEVIARIGTAKTARVHFLVILHGARSDQWKLVLHKMPRNYNNLAEVAMSAQQEKLKKIQQAREELRAS